MLSSKNFEKMEDGNPYEVCRNKGKRVNGTPPTKRDKRLHCTKGKRIQDIGKRVKENKEGWNIVECKQITFQKSCVFITTRCNMETNKKRC